MITEYLTLFVSYLLRNPKTEDSDLLGYLVAHNVPDNIAFDIVVYTPIAFNRQYFAPMGIKFSDEYYVYENEDFEVLKFSDNMIYNESIIFYRKNIGNKVSQSDLISIVGRCADFDAIVQALEGNIDYKDMRLEPMRFYY